VLVPLSSTSFTATNPTNDAARGRKKLSLCGTPKEGSARYPVISPFPQRNGPLAAQPYQAASCPQHQDTLDSHHAATLSFHSTYQLTMAMLPSGQTSADTRIEQDLIDPDDGTLTLPSTCNPFPTETKASVLMQLHHSRSRRSRRPPPAGQHE
jgi:hypothetical protein